jgi:hypothetical protein
VALASTQVVSLKILRVLGLKRKLVVGLKLQDFRPSQYVVVLQNCTFYQRGTTHTLHCIYFWKMMLVWQLGNVKILSVPNDIFSSDCMKVNYIVN